MTEPSLTWHARQQIELRRILDEERARAKTNANCKSVTETKSNPKSKAKTKAGAKPKAKPAKQRVEPPPGLVLGCAKCRARTWGCAQCWNPEFKGKRGKTSHADGMKRSAKKAKK